MRKVRGLEKVRAADDQSAVSKKHGTEMLAKSLLEQSNEKERKKQQAWKSKIQLCASLNCGVRQLKGRCKC